MVAIGGALLATALDAVLLAWALGGWRAVLAHPRAPALLAVWLVCAALWRRRDASREANAGASRGVRALQFAAAVAAVGALGLLLPDLRAGLADAWRWLAKQESFQAQVAESKPLLFDERGLNLDIALIRLSLFGLFYPLAAAWLGKTRLIDNMAV